MRTLSYRVALIVAVVSCIARVSVAQELPPGDGHDTVQSSCTACHGIDVIMSQRHTSDEWRDIVSQMIGNGASLTDDQFATVVKYLSTTLAPAGAASTTTAHATSTVSPAAAAH